VCELADVQPYVLRTWEAEFPDLGVAKTADGPRVYRRGDVERVLRIKHLLFIDGLTIAGARRRMVEEGDTAAAGDVSGGEMAALLNEDARRQLRDVRQGLQWILGVLGGQEAAGSFVIGTHPVARRTQARSRAKPAPRSGRGKPSRPPARASGRKRTPLGAKKR
jgi:DNA-binding transcriptional MerR regulator